MKIILGFKIWYIFKALCLVSLASYLSCDYKKSLKYAQKAVHCYPDTAETWTVLICALKGTSDKTLYNPKKISDFIIKNMKPSNVLNEWLTTHC